MSPETIDRAGRTIVFLAEPALFDAIDKTAGESLLAPSEWVRRHLEKILITQSENSKL